MTEVVIHSECLEALKAMPDNSVDSIVTDPPAGVALFSIELSTFTGSTTTQSQVHTGMKAGVKFSNKQRQVFMDGMTAIFAEAYRVLKPGGYAVVWALPRTSHWTAMAIENAGFEVRDCITHLFGSGFPKSINQGNGIGTSLKPASEHWWLVKKPIAEKTIKANIAKWGTGGLNIEECRIPYQIGETPNIGGRASHSRGDNYGLKAQGTGATAAPGRFPANVITDGEVLEQGRFFYQAKPSTAERGEGNIHPTLKPIALMKHLIQLVTPMGGVVLDPFGGSGTTALAARECGRGFIIIEKEEEYVRIINRRLGID